MVIFKKLLKIEFLSFISLNNMFDSKKGKVKSIDGVIAGLFLFGLFLMGMSGMYSFLLAFQLISLNAVYIMPTYMFVAGSLAVFFFTAFKSGEMLFKARDYDLLFSLPISNKTIIFSKLTTLYFSELIFALIFMLPCLVVWCYFDSPSLIRVLLVLLSSFLVPVVPIILATVIGTIVVFFQSRSRHKALVSIIANLVMVGAIMIFSTAMGSQSVSDTGFAQYALTIQKSLIGSYPLAKFFFDASQGNLVSFVIYFVISVALAVLFVLSLSGHFKKIVSKLSSVQLKASNSKLTYVTSSNFLALIKKEAKRFFSCPVYVTNCALMPAFAIVWALYLLIFGRSYIDLVTEIPQLHVIAVAFSPLLASFVSSVGTPSSVSVSMEGQSLWIAKHMPVSAYQIFLSKICFSLIITLPSVLVISLTAIFALKISGLSLIFTLIYPICITVFMTYFSLMINLTFPNFTWTSEMRVVKQSASSAISIFSAMGIFVIMFFVTNVLHGLKKANLGYAVSSAVLLVFIFGFNNFLKKNSQRIFNKF